MKVTGIISVLNRASRAIATGIAAIGITAGASSVSAADIEVLETDSYPLIVIMGEIVSGDAEKFRKIATSVDASGVILASPGGSLVEALEIGRIIQISGYITGVPEDTVCASACALIWLAGDERRAQEGALIGFHASYREERGRNIEDGAANALVGRYLTQLNLSARAVYFVSSASPDDMQWLDTDNPGKEGISYQVMARSEENEPAPRRSAAIDTRTQATSRESNAIKSYGKWDIVLDGFTGIRTKSVQGEQYLGLQCAQGFACRFLLVSGHSCDAGDMYVLDYMVRGYEPRQTMATCAIGENMFILDDTAQFHTSIIGETFVKFAMENTSDEIMDFDFPLIGYGTALEAFENAGYMQDWMGNTP